MGKTGNTVLVADDNTFIRFLIKKWLGAEARIIEVGNGREVIKAFREHKPDIVFLDIHLPGKSGKEALREIMAIDKNAFVVMLSADSNKDNVIYSVKTGAKAFITKPFTRDTLNKYYYMCPTVKRLEVTPVEEAEPEAGTGTP